MICKSGQTLIKERRYWLPERSTTSAVDF